MVVARTGVIEQRQEFLAPDNMAIDVEAGRCRKGCFTLQTSSFSLKSRGQTSHVTFLTPGLVPSFILCFLRQTILLVIKSFLLWARGRTPGVFSSMFVT